jgi:phage-related protein
MRDTFDMEVNESIRATNMMMKTFGLSGHDAYNLIAQGAQAGLDQNQNLLDTVNEYSVHFQQMGFSADEMFAMLSSGTASGVFDIDKLGDAVKEFGIRVKDESKGTMEAFTALGLDAQKISGDFAAGGASAKTAFKTATDAILEMKDPLKQNQIGVALFGTMWEDVGVKGIESLLAMESGIDKNRDSLAEINKIKYNSLWEFFAGLKRQFDVGVMIPLGDSVMPMLNNFANMIQQNMPMIKQAIGDTMAGFGTAFGGFVDNVMPIAMQAFDMFNKNILPVLIQLFEFITKEIVPALANAFAEWMPYIQEIITNLMAVFQKVWPIISASVMNAIENIKPFITALLRVLSGVIEFLTGVFTGDWKKVWTGIKNIFGGVFDAIGAMFRAMVNTVITGFNGLIRGINKLKFKLPDWMGGASFGLNIPQKPRMATGGTILDDGSVMVGEKGPEILTGMKGASVIPLDRKAGGNITINVAGNYIKEDYDVRRIAKDIVKVLKVEGVY